MDEPTGGRQVKMATQQQLKFARDLGLEVDESMTLSEVSKLITRKIRARGRAALKEFRPKMYDVVVHPKHGRCEIVAIHKKSVKLTLEPIDGGKKFVIDAMRLFDYPLNPDEPKDEPS